MSGSSRRTPRVEMKFVLDGAILEQVQDWAVDHLGIDKSCESDNRRSITALYLDTAKLDLLRGTGEAGKTSHRIRRDGNDQRLTIETKRTKKMVVRKNRSSVFESDLLPRLRSQCIGKVDGQETAEAWCGDWFLKRLTQRQLQPTVQVAFERFTRASVLNGEKLRLSIDSDMRVGPVDGWKLADGGLADSAGKFETLGDHLILKLKFRDQMPHLFKELLRAFPLPSVRFSKYQVAMAGRHHAFGCPQPVRGLSVTSETIPTECVSYA
ncbi:VTC domain-containing protein [Neorhodopirellula lusitana]|uniref:VTC domain-containing protein n=1 Tax=Neorhodopirellula lusitana TaxID=445327 RepID=A0ABY1QK57_9BACT|nr:VTC domain-containing protein [Neorhodopirellula lusitana]SMP73108.1 VTC domain-containing protein [Neorhodopirellula lusitana]